MLILRRLSTWICAKCYRESYSRKKSDWLSPCWKGSRMLEVVGMYGICHKSCSWRHIPPYEYFSDQVFSYIQILIKFTEHVWKGQAVFFFSDVCCRMFIVITLLSMSVRFYFGSTFLLPVFFLSKKLVECEMNYKMYKEIVLSLGASDAYQLHR